MWELIRRNKRKSVILFFGMGLCLVVLGFSIGRIFPPEGGTVGIIAALCVWLVMSCTSYFFGNSIILSMSGAREVTYDVHPQLFNIVEEMKIAAGFPYMPKVYIIDASSPNAFASGISQDESSISVTAGLLARLNRDELQGVFAHEMSHILNRDVLFMTFAGVLLGSITFISEMFLRGWGRSSGSVRYRSGSSDGARGQIIAVIIAILCAILAPIVARILYFAISRQREYLADASAVRLTRYPEGLASALEKISSNVIPLLSANKITAPMYIVNPLAGEGMKLEDLESTHPPIEERIRILRSMEFGAGYTDYQRAFSKVKRDTTPIIPAAGLKDTAAVPFRKASAGEDIRMHGEKSRDIGNLIMAVNNFRFLNCTCGLKIKVPPDFRLPEIICPKCRKKVSVPRAETVSSAVVQDGTDSGLMQDTRPQVYVRKSKGWETFSCSCGHLIQVSPAFEGSQVVCKKCGRKTEIQ